MKRYKDLVKINPAPKSRFGINPSDPWSTKANIAEGRNSILKKFILSKGIDPVSLSGDSMIAFAKSLEFQKWAADRKLRGEAVDSPTMLSQRRLQSKLNKHKVIHAVGGLGEESDLDETYPGHSSTVKNPNFNDELSIRRVSPPGRRLKSGKLSADERGSQERTKRLMQFTKAKGGLTGPKGNLPEEVDRKDTVTVDIPLLIRLLELAREDIKTDMDLHRVVERIINIRNKGVLTMDDYDTVANINDKKYKKTNSNLRAIRAKNVANKIKASAVRKEETELEESTIKVGDAVVWNKGKTGQTAGKVHRIDADDYILHHTKTNTYHRVPKQGSELIKEMDNRTPSGDRRERRAYGPEAIAQREKETQSQLKKVSPELRKKLRLPEPKEGMSENIDEDKFQDSQAATQTTGMEVESKASKMIKALRKKRNVKEELYDWEKEDKSVQSYGKKPKFGKPNPNSKSNLAADTTVSRAVMSGGTTLTGEKRDDVEIDPMMKNRPTIPMDDNKKVKKAKI